jgi:hypothetical protein
MTKAIPSVDFNPYNDLILHLLRGAWHFVFNALERFAVTLGYTFNNINNRMNQSIAAAL